MVGNPALTRWGRRCEFQVIFSHIVSLELKPGGAAHTYNPSTREAKAGASNSGQLDHIVTSCLKNKADKQKDILNTHDF